MAQRLFDPPSDLGPTLWSQALSGQANVTVLLEPSFTFTVHFSVLTARAPALARLVVQNSKAQFSMTLDLRGEERPLVLCMLEYLYVNEYTALTNADAEDLQWAAAARVYAGYHNRMYLLGGKYGLLRLQAFAWNRVQIFQRLLQDGPGMLRKIKFIQRPLRPFVKQGQGQGESSKGKERENSNRPIIIED